MQVKDHSIRGKILEFLKDIYPEGADRQTIVGIFYEYHKYPAIIQALEYLTDKEYILKTEQPHPYRKRETICVYKLSPSGVDLTDGTISDPGICLVPEEA